MENQNQIYSRIITFQKSMPTIRKDETNPFFKSKYAPLDAIQKAIQVPLADAGLGYVQEATTQGLKTTLFDIDGNIKEFMYPAIFSGKPQEIGSAMTYAKRYALTACLGLIIEGDDDDDGNKAQSTQKQVKNQNSNQKPPAESPKPPGKMTAKKALEELILKLENNKVKEFEKAKIWLLENQSKIPAELFPAELLSKATELITLKEKENQPKIEIKFDQNYVN